jgi:hypothetical protein
MPPHVYAVLRAGASPAGLIFRCTFALDATGCRPFPPSPVPELRSARRRPIYVALAPPFRSRPRLGTSNVNTHDAYYKLAEKMGRAILSDIDFDMMLQVGNGEEAELETKRGGAPSLARRRQRLSLGLCCCCVAVPAVLGSATCDP